MGKDIFKSKKKGRPAGESQNSSKPTKEMILRVANRQASAQVNTSLAIEESRRKSEEEEYYASKGFDNPVMPVSGDASISFVYGSSSHNYSHG